MIFMPGRREKDLLFDTGYRAAIDDMLDGSAMTYLHTAMEKLLMQIIVRDERRNRHGSKEVKRSGNQGNL